MIALAYRRELLPQQYLSMLMLSLENLAGRSDAIRVVDYGLGLTKKESLVLYYALK